MSDPKTELATQHAEKLFDIVNAMLPNDMFAITLIIGARPTEEGNLPVGTCLCNELDNQQKALLFNRLGKLLADMPVDANIDFQETVEVPQ